MAALLESNETFCYDALCSNFGDRIVTEEGIITKDLIQRLPFNEYGLAMKIIDDSIQRSLDSLAETYKDTSAKVFYSSTRLPDFKAEWDTVISIYANKKTCLQRLMVRDNWRTEGETVCELQRQKTGYFNQKADLIVINSERTSLEQYQQSIRFLMGNL